jgi:hypothetical protein
MISPKPNSNFQECWPIKTIVSKRDSRNEKPNPSIGPKKFEIGN